MEKKKFNNGMLVGIVVAVLIVIAGVYLFMGNEETSTTKVKFETTEGDVVIELYSDMPVTAGNFKKLVGRGYILKRGFWNVHLWAREPLKR